MESRASSSRTLLSVVSPVYNEQVLVDQLVDRLEQSLAETGMDWELVLVNDGSTDATLDRLVARLDTSPHLRIVDLTRNFGHQAAMLAGLAETRGDFIAMIDGDLQDPPELLPEMLRHLQSGLDVVYGVRRKRKEGLAKRLAYDLAYRIINALSRVDLPLDSGDFCMIRRCVADDMLRLKEQGLYLRGIRAWVGYRQRSLEYERAARAGGEPKYRWRDLMRLAANGLFGFSDVPIRLLGQLGMAAILGSLAYTAYLFYALWFEGSVPRGFTTLILAIMFFSGVQLVGLRIIGEYVSRTYDEARNRPRFLVRRVIARSD